MTDLTPDILNRPQTLAEVISRLQAMPKLDASLRRDLVSAVTRTSTLIGRQPEEIAADVPRLRNALSKVSRPHSRLSRKSFSNILASLARALMITRVIPRLPPERPISPAWEAFFANAQAKHQIWGLMRFARFCMARRVEPADVTDEIISAYQADLERRQLTKEPFELCKEVVWTFNLIAGRAQLNRPLLTPLASKRFRAAPLETYPQALQTEIKDYLNRLAFVDLFAKSGPRKALKPMSIRNVEAHIRQFLDAAVVAGLQRGEFCSLADVVNPDVVKAAFKKLFERNGGEMPVGLQNMAGTLLGIARHHVKAPPEDITALKNLKARTFTDLRGMSTKNAERLDQFADWRNRAALVTLPETLLARARSRLTSPRSALDAMHAAAIAILLACPMRVKNLAGLDLNEHLRVVSGKGKHRIYAVRIESRQVKNGSPIDVNLGREASAILRAYLDQFRHRLAENPGSALFPKRSSGAARDPANFGQSLQATIKRETGLVVNPHFFRHFAAKLYLEAHPGDYETVRRLLGHKKLATTLSFYAAFDNDMAHDRFHDTVLAARQPRKPKK